MVLAGNSIAFKNIMYICKRGTKDCFLRSNLNLKPMKRVLIACLLFCFLSLPTLSQSRVGFAYDAAGNRVKKELNVSPPQKSAKGPKTSSLWDSIDQRSVQIITDNSTGNIKVVFLNVNEEDKRNISICTSAGAKIYETAVESDECLIKLSEHPSGIYLLTITINDTPSTWKITKK